MTKILAPIIAVHVKCTTEPLSTSWKCASKDKAARGGIYITKRQTFRLSISYATLSLPAAPRLQPQYLENFVFKELNDTARDKSILGSNGKTFLLVPLVAIFAQSDLIYAHVFACPAYLTARKLSTTSILKTQHHCENG